MIIIDISHPDRLKKLSRPSSNFENAIRRRPAPKNERLNESIANCLPVHLPAPKHTREPPPTEDPGFRESATPIGKAEFKEELKKRSDPAWQATLATPTPIDGLKSAIENGVRPEERRRRISWKDGRIVVHWKASERLLQAGNNEQEQPHCRENERSSPQDEIRMSEGTTGESSKQTSPERRVACDINRESSSARHLQRGELSRMEIGAIEENRKTRAKVVRKNRLAEVKRRVLKWLSL